MPKEIEVKFLNVDHGEMRKKLRALNADLVHSSRLMKRILFDYSDGRLQKQNWGRLRVRDEGDKVTLTFKQGGEKEYSDEIETTVGNFDNTVKLLRAIGLKNIVFQESKRETWKIDNVEIVLDEWPYLDTYIEIEGASEVAIKDCASKLGFQWEDGAFGNVDTAYREQYPRMTESETINAMPKLMFNQPRPEWLEQRM